VVVFVWPDMKIMDDVIYWVIIANPTGEVVRRRPHGSQAAAEEFAQVQRNQYPGHTVEVRALPSGQFPDLPRDTLKARPARRN
jgi:hypothetical protein